MPKPWSIAGERWQHERNQPYRIVREVEQPRVQSDRRRDGVLQVAGESVRRAGPLDPADSPDTRLRPASHRPALRTGSIATGEGRDRRFGSAAARRDVDLGFV